MSFSSWFQVEYKHIICGTVGAVVVYVIVKNLWDKKKQEMNLKSCAEAILNADFCLLTTGAGFSADSGLKVFKDIANIDVYRKHKLTYYDLSQPDNIQKRPLIAYGFWFYCYNIYKDAFPHNGYYILKQWKHKYFHSNTSSSKLLQTYLTNKNNTISSFFCYTSNIDSLHQRAGFNDNEIDEIHGNMLQFQCSKRCCRKRWSLNDNYRFKIDENKLLPLNIDYDNGNTDNDGISEFKPPFCKYCKKYPARPAIEMFKDFYFVGRKNRIDEWEKCVQQLCNDKNMKLVIIEIGAGIRVPSIRNHGEGLLQRIKNCTLIRCNPDFAEVPKRRNMVGSFISIKMKGLEFIETMDNVLKKYDIN